MSQLLKSSGALSAATMVSRVLGLVRETVYAAFMGDGWVAGAFVLAFMVPNLFRRLLGEGALTAAFIPIFKEKEKASGEPDMWRAANAVLSGLVVSAAAVVAVGMAGISVMLFAVKPAEAKRLAWLLSDVFPWVVGLGVLGLLVLWRRVELPLSRPVRAAVGVSTGLVMLFLGCASLA